MEIARVRNLTNANGRPWANQINITFKTPDGDELEILQSYDAKVAFVDRNCEPKHITLGDKWDYSATTLRAVCKFLEDYTGFKWDKKSINEALDRGEFHIINYNHNGVEHWEVRRGADCYFDDFFKH